MNDPPSTYLVRKGEQQGGGDRGRVYSFTRELESQYSEGPRPPHSVAAVQQCHLTLPDDKGRQGAVRWVAVYFAHCEVAGIYDVSL